MVAAVCAVFTLVVAGYVFWPERVVAPQVQKPRAEYLRERAAAIEDNLRDLRFEREAGKYGEGEYTTERSALEVEAAAVRAELDGRGRL